MPRDYEIYLEDIRDAIDKIKRYTDGLSLEAFEKDDSRGSHSHPASAG